MTGEKLEADVAKIVAALTLDSRRHFIMGRRLWGARREVDLLVTHPETRRRVGIECKFQGVSGSAEEKLIATLQDIAAWPIHGIVVLDGVGFSEHMVLQPGGSLMLFALVYANDGLRIFAPSVAPFDGEDIASAEAEAHRTLCESFDTYPTPIEWLAAEGLRIVPLNGHLEDQYPEAT